MRGKVFAVALLAGPLLAGCASVDSDTPYTALPREPGRNLVRGDRVPQQCVPFARDHSQVKLYGDAWTWWDQAAGRYPRGDKPEEGAVLVLNDYAGPERGHLAVV